MALFPKDFVVSLDIHCIRCVAPTMQSLSLHQVCSPQSLSLHQVSVVQHWLQFTHCNALAHLRVGGSDQHVSLLVCQMISVPGYWYKYARLLVITMPGYQLLLFQVNNYWYVRLLVYQVVNICQYARLLLLVQYARLSVHLPAVTCCLVMCLCHLCIHVPVPSTFMCLYHFCTVQVYTYIQVCTIVA